MDIRHTILFFPHKKTSEETRFPFHPLVTDITDITDTDTVQQLLDCGQRITSVNEK